MILTAIIVDDEPLARNLLATILGEMDDVSIISQCANGFEAIESITANTPDMVFLDIEMPEMNGFDVIKAIQADILPKVIFTTAYTEYAIEAFRVEALDYVLKPLDDEKVRESVERVKKALQSGEKENSKSDMLTALTVPRNENEQSNLIVKNSDKISILDKSEIDWVEADGDYICIHIGARTHLIRSTMKSVEIQLSDLNFMRIHRSTIVNLDRIQEILPASKGEAVIVTEFGQRLKVSRSYGASLRAKFA
jgi:two-component system LytT family response regulator